MNRVRYHLDTSIGTIDLLWNLVQVFFLTTFVVVRPLGALLAAPSVPSSGPGRAVVLTADESRWAGSTAAERAESLAAVPDGGGEAAAPDQPLDLWLGSRCDDALVVQVDLPSTATHRECQEVMALLLERAPRCQFQY